MKFVGYRYVFGGTSPSGFDCSGFVYYIHNHSGAPVGRGMWQQYNGGAHIRMSALQPGDTVFFANTYMPGLSHDGIYIGGGQFVHASDERTGVTVSSLYSAYWQAALRRRHAPLGSLVSATLRARQSGALLPSTASCCSRARQAAAPEHVGPAAREQIRAAAPEQGNGCCG